MEALSDEKVDDGFVNELRYLLCWILIFIDGIEFIKYFFRICNGNCQLQPLRMYLSKL